MWKVGKHIVCTCFLKVNLRNLACVQEIKNLKLGKSLEKVPRCFLWSSEEQELVKQCCLQQRFSHVDLHWELLVEHSKPQAIKSHFRLIKSEIQRKEWKWKWMFSAFKAPHLNFLKVLLEGRCLTMSCWFLFYSNVNELDVYISLLFFGFLSRLGHHRALSGVPFAI